VVIIVWQLDVPLPMKLVIIASKFVSSHPAHGEVYSIQIFEAQFVKLFYSGRWVFFLSVVRFLYTHINDCGNIT
jgi:hypothetical protein